MPTDLHPDYETLKLKWILHFTKLQSGNRLLDCTEIGAGAGARDFNCVSVWQRGWPKSLAANAFVAAARWIFKLTKVFHTGSEPKWKRMKNIQDFFSFAFRQWIKINHWKRLIREKPHVPFDFKKIYKFGWMWETQFAAFRQSKNSSSKFSEYCV